MEKIVADSYIQGGAVLLLVALSVCSVICTFMFIVKPLWNENKSLRDKVMEMNERVVRMGEASRMTNETTTKALVEQTAAFQLVISGWRAR